MPIRVIIHGHHPDAHATEVGYDTEGKLIHLPVSIDDLFEVAGMASENVDISL